MRPPRIGNLALCLLVAVGGAAGCRRGSETTYQTYGTAAPAYVPREGSGNAFDGYALAAMQVEQQGGKHLTRVSFYPDQKRAAMAICAPALRLVASASRQACEFEYVPRRPFEPAPYQRGWRLIGRAMRWRIEEAAQAERWGEAVSETVLATRFGFDLAGGGATDASLGLAIADDARQAILPFIAKIPTGDLERLNLGLQEAIKRKPKLSVVVGHERDEAHLAVETLQDSYRADQWDAFRQNLGLDVREAIQYLRDLRKEGESERVAYFNGLYQEGEAQLEYLQKAADMTAAERAALPKPTLKRERPWKRFARHFFETARPLIELNDRAMARTRMLAIHAELVRLGKKAGSFPSTLRALPAELTIDPYTGKPFAYRADRVQFLLYSFGVNLRDDGGDTDESATVPDLKLEGM